MKRLPLAASFILFVALCASIAYWGLALYKPPLRPVAAPSTATVSDVDLSAAAGLFGGRGAVAVASNYQLKGVIVADDPAGSVAILSADGKPARAYPVGVEISPGATVKEVHPGFVLVSESGVVKRVDLPEDVKSQAADGNAGTPPVGSAAQRMPMQPMQQSGAVQQEPPPSQNPSEEVNPSMQESGESVNPSMPPPQVVEPMPSGSQPVPPEQQEGNAPASQQGLPSGMQAQQPPGFPQPGAQQQGGQQQGTQQQGTQQAPPAQGQNQAPGAR